MDRESFLTRGTKLPTTDITLDDGQIVHARKLSQAEVETLKKKYGVDDKALEGFRYIVSRCVIDENGKRMFADDDMAALAAVDFEAIKRIAEDVMRFSGLHVPNA